MLPPALRDASPGSRLRPVRLLVIACTAVATGHPAARGAPTAADDGFQTPGATPLVVDAAHGLLANDTAAVTAAAVTLPAHGSLDLAPDGSFTYAPAPGFRGTDSFTYRALGPAVRDVAMTVDPARSSAGIAASLVTDFGTRSDEDTTAINGTATLCIDPARAPFHSIHITGFDFTAADGADLRFDYGFLAGRVDVTVPANALRVTLEVPGPAATAAPSGAFTQPDNAVRATGTAEVSATRGLALVIPDADETIDSTQIIDIEGARLVETDGRLELSIPLDFQAELPAAEGLAVGIAMTGAVVATAPLPSPPEASPPATVEIVVGDPGPVDTDDDGMDDRFEEDAGLVVGIDDSADDPDGDQATNLEEFLAGTDPRDARSRFATTSISLAPDGLLSLTVSAVPGRTYTAESSAPGDAAPAWKPIDFPSATATAGGNDTTVTLTFPPPAAGPATTTLLLRARTTAP